LECFCCDFNFFKEQKVVWKEMIGGGARWRAKAKVKSETGDDVSKCVRKRAKVQTSDKPFKLQPSLARTSKNAKVLSDLTEFQAVSREVYTKMSVFKEDDVLTMLTS
jgi:hypothetical protein